MYSARTINSINIPEGLKVADNLPATESALPGVGGVFSSRSGDFDLVGRDAWLFISIKNRSFDRPYINKFIDLCDNLELNGHICPVDYPYRYNRMAELKSDALPIEEGEKIERVSAEITRMAQKAINGKCTMQVDLLKWRALQDATPSVYFEELSNAFHQRTKIRDILFDHISSVKTLETEKDFERFAQFFLCEVPVLLYAYYSNGPTLDIYPGPQPKFFWQIEMGYFKNELPNLTKLTTAGRSLLYLDTHNRRRKQ